jgi:hypothetical protein
MRRAHFFLSALGPCLWAGVALANGGGYSFGVTFTGSVAPFQASGTEHVRILEEKLDVDLRRTDASVAVRYTMKNVAGEPVRVRFGFPVEARPRDEDELGGDEPQSPEQRRKDLLRAIQQLEGYAVTADGKPVRSEFQVEPFATGSVKAFPGSRTLQGIGGWMVSEVTFPAGAPVVLEIRYSADYMGELSFVSDDVNRSELSFVYRLSTGAVWSGPIGKGIVTLRADGIPADEVEVAAPRERFARNGDRWTWAFHDLEPTLADDITIRAIPGFFEKTGFYGESPLLSDSLAYLERAGKWGEGHQRFRAKASSTLAPAKDHGFGPEHLAERSPAAPWAEGVAGPGIGEWVELQATRPRPLLAIEIWPGFQSAKRPERFRQNGRPARVEIVLDGEHRFTATLGDRPEGQLVPILGYSKPVSKVRIAILDVFPGTRFADTCISCTTASRRSPRSATLGRLLLLALAPCGALPAQAQDAQRPLPVYLEDDHAGTFHFLATTVDLGRPHVLVLVDAHPDSSPPRGLDALREGLRRVISPEEREARVRAWRREGAVQSFDWILPLMPSPLAQVIWVRPATAGEGTRVEPAGGATLPPGFTVARLEDLEARLPADLPVVVSVDLDAFSGLPEAEQTARFSDVWRHVVRLPRLSAVAFAVSRPWLADDAEASRLVLLALRSSFSLAHAAIRLEPWGIEGPDRSERAKAFYRERREPPRFDPETASPELRSLLLADAERIDVRLDPSRWRDLLARWRAEGSDWRVSVEGLEPDSDRVYRPEPGAAPELRVVGGPPGRIRGVTWLRWTPGAWSYDVLPELPAGKVFAGAAPPVVEYRAAVLARTASPSLGAEDWMAALPGPDRSGVLRVSAELETEDGVAHTARIEIRRGVGSGFRAGLSEQFGLPYVFGAGFLRRGGLRGPDTGVGNDCANFLVLAWRRSGLRMPWSNPAQLRGHLVGLAEAVRASDRLAIPEDASSRGLVVHLGSHVAALWEDREPVGTLGPEDLVVHHLGGAPEVISLARLLDGRERPTFDVYLGPSREAAAWIAVGGDVMPGASGPAPAGLRDRLREADLAVANLETTVGRAGRAVEKRYAFRIPPARLADLRAVGIRALSVANNHAGDFGPEGLQETLSALDASGLGHFGAGEDASSAVSAWYGRVKDLTVAFVAVSLADPDLLPAGPRQRGMATLPRHEREVAEAIATARTRARCVIVLPHWGDEGSTGVTEEQRRWARWFVEQGADAVVGSGPHVIQAHETIAGAPVYYSVGNLWFDGSWPAGSRTAGIVFLGLDPGGRVVASRLERVALANGPPRRASRAPRRTDVVAGRPGGLLVASPRR